MCHQFYFSKGLTEREAEPMTLCLAISIIIKVAVKDEKRCLPTVSSQADNITHPAKEAQNIICIKIDCR